MNEISQKIDQMRAARGWTIYKLSEESGLPAPTIRKWFNRDSYPTFPALKRVCEAFGITIATFFAEGELVEVSPKVKKLYTQWCALDKSEQDAVEEIVNKLIDKK